MFSSIMNENSFRRHRTFYWLVINLVDFIGKLINLLSNILQIYMFILIWTEIDELMHNMFKYLECNEMLHNQHMQMVLHVILIAYRTLAGNYASTTLYTNIYVCVKKRERESFYIVKKIQKMKKEYKLQLE